MLRSSSNGVSSRQRVREVDPGAAGELVAAALGDDVDHAAGELAVLGGDARGQHLGLFDRALDEEVVGGAEDRVHDVDAVDHDGVVVGEPAVDLDLAGVGRVVVEARGQLGDVLDGGGRWPACRSPRSRSCR